MADRDDAAEPAGGSPVRRRGGPPRILALAAVAVVVALVAILAQPSTEPPGPSSVPTLVAPSAPASSALPSPEPTGTPTPPASAPGSAPAAPGGYLASLAEIRSRAALAREGIEPYRSALDELLAWAATARLDPPRPQAVIHIPGTEGPFVDDSARAYGLAVAWAATGDPADAAAARDLLVAWATTAHATRDACTDSGACQTSLIISRAAPGWVFAADLIAGSGAYDAADDRLVREWLAEVILPTASRLENNWGDAGTFTRIVLARYLGDGPELAAALAKWRSLLDLVAPDGHIPLEVARARGGVGYTQEALDYKVAAARVAETGGLDLWDYRGAQGASLRDAVDYLASWWDRLDQWPWYPDVRQRPASGMWEIAYQHWPTTSWQPIVASARPYGEAGHSAVRWTTLTNGVPFATP